MDFIQGAAPAAGRCRGAGANDVPSTGCCSWEPPEKGSAAFRGLCWHPGRLQLPMLQGEKKPTLQLKREKKKIKPPLIPSPAPEQTPRDGLASSCCAELTGVSEGREEGAWEALDVNLIFL